jgi:hypothetical protein
MGRWLPSALLVGVVFGMAAVYYAYRVLNREKNMKRQEEWRKVLGSEMERWSAKSYDQLASGLHDGQSYAVEFDGKEYQVEVELLEKTESYIHAMLSVDDGSLPASISPLTRGFIREKEAPDARA